MNELAEAKRRLYYLLLQKKDWTDNEINIGYYLACDKDIQRLIDEALKKGKPMSIECRCDECNKAIDVGDNTICQKCYNVLLDKIDYLEKEISELQRIIEEAKDE